MSCSRGRMSIGQQQVPVNDSHPRLCCDLLGGVEHYDWQSTPSALYDPAVYMMLGITCLES